MSRLPSAVRQQAIRKLLAHQPGVSAGILATRLGVSEMTIRRDFAALEAKAQIERTHGGAVLTERMILEFDYRKRLERNRDAKRAIAAEARKLVKSGQRIILDTGTTTLELATLLKDGENLTIITPSLAAASELQHSPGLEVILLGGIIRRGSPDLTGPVTENSLELFAVDFAFQGAEGISTDGTVYTSDLRMARVDRIMRRVASKSCVLADHTKIGSTAFARNGSLADVDYFITDAEAPAAALKRFARMGPRVIRASAA